MSEKVVKVKLAGDTANFQANWSKASNTLTRFSAKTQAVSKVVQAQGRAMALGLSLPIIAGLGAGVKAFGSFDKAMTESLAIMGDVSDKTKQQMASLAKQMSGESTFSAKSLAESYFYLASAGLDATKSMEALPVVTKFAQAGAFDMAKATDLLTDAYSALGPSIQKSGDLITDMTGLSDLLVKANTLANASVQQFSEALTNEAGAAMRNYNIEVEDGISVLATYADQGIKGAHAGALYSRSIRLLTKTAEENSSVFKEMGIEVFNAQGEFVQFSQLAASMERSFEGMSTQAKAAALSQLGFKARAQQAILPIIGASEAMRGYKAGLEDVKGITDEVASKQLQAFSNQMTMLKNKVVGAFSAIGETLIPTVKKIADKVGELTEKFMALSPETKKTIANALLFVAAIGPVLIIVGKLIGLLGTLTTVIRGVGAALMFASANPIIVIIAGVVAVIAAVVKLVQVLRRLKREAASTKWSNGVADGQAILAESIKEANAAREAVKLKDAASIIGTGPATSADSPFVPSENDKAAALDFQKEMEKAVFNQMNTQQKINTLIGKRESILASMKSMQQGSEKFEKAKLEALKTEVALKEAFDSREGEIKDQADKDADRSKLFAGALEKGSVGDYQARIRTGAKDQQLAIQKKQEKQLADLNKKMEESVDLLASGFQNAATGNVSTVVSIAV